MESQNPGDRVATVLLVDQNPEVGFGLRASLANQPHLRLVEAGGREQAMDVLITQVVDVLVACVHTPEEDGLPLLQQVRQQEHLAALPFLLIADDDRVASKVLAFRHGATDYVARPFAMAEVVARVEAAALMAEARRTASTVFRTSCTRRIDTRCMTARPDITAVATSRSPTSCTCCRSASAPAP